MTRTSTWLALSIAALAAGCAVEYKPPPEGVATAAITLSTTTYGGAEFTSISGCPSPVRGELARFPFTLSGASMGESAKRSSPARLVAANRPLTVLASIAGTTCNWTATFTPKSGVDYEAVLHASNNRCQLSVYTVKPIAGGAPRLEPEGGAKYKLHKTVNDPCS